MKTPRRILAIFLSLIMAFSVCAVALVPASAAENEPTLIGQYFSTDNVWYDTVTNNKDALQWQDGTVYPTYNANLGMTYLNGTYVRIANEALFSGVDQTTGVTFAFNYRPNFTGNHRHILSIGKYAYNENNTANHFFISGTNCHTTSDCFPKVAWVNGSGTETIAAYPQGLKPEAGKEYNIVVTVDYDEGVIFYIDGKMQTTLYEDDEYLDNVRSFLAEVNTYTENYIGCSRWHDTLLEGYLSDMRIYGSSMVDENAYSLVADMAKATTLKFEQPTFNAPMYFCEEQDPVEEFSNVVYASKGLANTAFKGNGDNELDISGMKFKIVTQKNTIMVYDGQNTPSAPIEAETKASSGYRYIDYIESLTSGLTLKQAWYGCMDGNGNNYTLWAKYHIGGVTGEFSNASSLKSRLQQDNTGTSRFWWNILEYTGAMSSDTFLTKFSNVEFDAGATYQATNWRGQPNGTFTEGNKTITTESNYYVLNYRPVYDVISTTAREKYDAEMSPSNAWMYTDESYAQALLAYRRLTLCSPSYYDYLSSDIGVEAQARANAIEQAIGAYNAVELDKKTSTITVEPGVGTTITVNGTTYSEKTTLESVEYGALSVSAAALEAYSQSEPVTASVVKDEASDHDDRIDSPNITISTEDLELNEYTVTFEDKDGNQIGDAHTVKHGGSVEAPQADEYIENDGNSHYKFTGWSTENYKNVTSDLTVKAEYTTENHSWVGAANDGWTKDNEDTHSRDCTLCKRHEEDNHNYGDGWTSKDDNDHERDCVVCERHEEDAHKWVEGDWAVKPSCTVDGTKLYTCSDCGKTKNEVVVGSATNHNYDGQPWYDGEDGNHYRDCKNGCDTKDSHESNFGDWTDNGANHTRTCDCGLTETTAHTYTGWTADDETHTGTCVCGKSDSHAAAWDEGRVTKEATTTETGERTYTCDTCGLTKTEEIPMIKDDHEHNFEGQPWVSDGKGYHYQECVDGDGRSDLVACTEGEGVQTLPPTCGAEGTMTYSCTECRYVVRTESIGKLPHAESAREVRNARDAMCEVTGYTGDVYCKDCDTLLESGEEIAALEHSYANKNVVDSKAATCNENGYIVYTCDNGCGKTTKVTTLPNGKHTGGTATCLAKAVCEVCGKEYGETDPNNHNFGEWKVVKEPTCTKAGLEATACAACHEDITREIPALGHVDKDRDDNCDICDADLFRCGFCSKLEAEMGTMLTPIYAFVHTIIHFIFRILHSWGIL